MRYPVGRSKQDYEDNWYSSQHYGNPTSYGYHDGLDLNLRTGGNTDLGQPLYAISDGEVTSVHHHATAWGNHVHIKHIGEWGTCYSHYAHCLTISVKVGDRVTEGQKIGTLGNSGRSTAAHLHFSIKKKPTGVDSVARTLAELHEGWYDPVSFFNKYMETDMDEALKACMADREKFWRERDAALADLAKAEKELELQSAKLLECQKNLSTLLTESSAQIEVLQKQVDTLTAEIEKLNAEIEKLKSENPCDGYSGIELIVMGIKKLLGVKNG